MAPLNLIFTEYTLYLSLIVERSIGCMGFLSKTFGNRSDEAALKDRSVIEIGPGRFDNDKPEWFDSRAINFQHILKTGEIPIESVWDPLIGFGEWVSGSKSDRSQHIDWESDDAFIYEVSPNTIKRALMRLDDIAA